MLNFRSGLLLAVTVFLVSPSPAAELLPTSPQAARIESEKQIRQLLAKIPLDMNSCIAVIDSVYPNTINTLACDGQDLLKDQIIIQAESMFRKISYPEAVSVFLSVMLDSGFELKSHSAPRALETYMFQRIRPREQIGSEGF